MQPKPKDWLRTSPFSFCDLAAAILVAPAPAEHKATKALPNTGDLTSIMQGVMHHARHTRDACECPAPKDLNTPQSQELSELVADLSQRMEAGEAS